MEVLACTYFQICLMERELQLVSLRNVAVRDTLDMQKHLNLYKPLNVWETLLHFLQSGTRFGQGLINRTLNYFNLNQKLKTQALLQIGQ